MLCYLSHDFLYCPEEYMASRWITCTPARTQDRDVDRNFPWSTFVGGRSVSLTDARIKRLKPRNSRYLVTDGRGLCLEVLPSGRLSCLYRYSWHGKPEKVAIGHYPEMSLKTARTERDKLA